MYPAGAQARRASPTSIADARRDFAASNQAMATSDAFPLMPERILAEVRAQLPRDAIITTDVGWNKNGVGQQFPVYTPGSVLTPGGFATMGFGPPAAIGAKIARPDRVVLSLVGDGGFGQNPVGARHRRRARSRHHLAGHEQQCVRHDRRPAKGRVRPDARHAVSGREGRLGCAEAQLCGDRARLRLRGRAA